MRRIDGNNLRQRYVGNRQDKTVHDLDHEKPQCRIDEIVDNDLDVPFVTLLQIEKAGYIFCEFCFEHTEITEDKQSW